jgi:O-acetyl-ADP-ribose deacetylase (regulator of RNase III)
MFFGKRNINTKDTLLYMTEIEIKKTSLTSTLVDAIIVFGNSYGLFQEETPAVIKAVGGEMIEEDAISKAPIMIGQAEICFSGDLPCKQIILAPVKENVTEKTDSQKVSDAFDAAIKKAQEKKFQRIALCLSDFDEETKEIIARKIENLKSEVIVKIIITEN